MYRSSIFAVVLLALAALAPVSAYVQTVEFSRTITFDDVTVTVSGSFTVDTTAKTLVGTTSLTAVNNTSGETIFSKTFDISLVFATSNSIKFVLKIPAIPFALGVGCAVDVATSSASCIVSRDPDVNRDGVINILDLVGVASGFWAREGDSRFNPTSDLNANGRIDILDLVILGTNFGAPVFK